MSTCHHKSGRKRTQNLAILFLTYLNFKPRLKLKRETKVRFARFVAVGHWTGVCTAVFSISKVQAKNQIRERNRMIHIMIRTLCWRGTLDRCMYCRLRPLYHSKTWYHKIYYISYRGTLETGQVYVLLLPQTITTCLLNVTNLPLHKGLFTYYVSQNGGFVAPPLVSNGQLLGDPPSPPRQQWSAFDLPPLPPLSAMVSIWLTPPPPLVSNCQHLPDPLPPLRRLT